MCRIAWAARCAETQGDNIMSLTPVRVLVLLCDGIVSPADMTKKANAERSRRCEAYANLTDGSRRARRLFGEPERKIVEALDGIRSGGRSAQPDLGDGVALTTASALLFLFLIALELVGVLQNPLWRRRGQRVEGVLWAGVPQRDETRIRRSSERSARTCRVRVMRHVRPGAGAFLTAKLNGSRQLWLVSSGAFRRPIRANRRVC